MRIAMLGVKGIPYTGGIENVVEQLGSRLVRKGHEVIVYVRPHYMPRGQSEYKGMKLIYLPSLRTKYFDALIHSFLASIHSLFLKIDIAHIHSTGLSILALFPRAKGVKTIVQSHGLDWQRKKWGHFAKAYLKMSDYFTVSFPNATTVVSKKMKKYYEDKFRKNVHYIPNGVNDFSKVEPKEIHSLGIREDEYILFASRLVPEKGCHYLIKAYKELENPSKKLVIAGDANYRSRYTSELKKQGNENIIFLGFVRGRLLQELMSNAYIYVQPSEIEGLSIALLEAMSYGNCVVVSDIEENLEVIGDCGFYFRDRNYKDLKRVLEFLMRNEEIVYEMRRKARDHVIKAYNWDLVADQFEALYFSLLDKDQKWVEGTVDSQRSKGENKRRVAS